MAKRAQASFRAKDGQGPVAPTALIESRELSPMDKMVWITIRNFEGKNENAWPSLNTIAETLDVSRRSIIRSVRILTDQKWLVVGKNDGQHGVNTYECWIPCGVDNVFVSGGQPCGELVGGSDKKDTGGGDNLALPPGDNLAPKPIQGLTKPDEPSQLRSNHNIFDFKALGGKRVRQPTPIGDVLEKIYLL